MRKNAVRCFIIIMCLGSAPIFARDLTVISKGRAGSETLFLTNGKAKLSRDQADCIIETGGRIIVVDKAKKDFYETSLAEISEHVRRLVPKDTMAARSLAKTYSGLKVIQGKKSRKIAGYNCGQYLLRVREGDYEFWATSELQAPDGYYDLIEKSSAAMSPLTNPNSMLIGEMRRLNLIPLTTTLTSMHVGGIPDMFGVGMQNQAKGIVMLLPGVGVKGKTQADPLLEAVEVKMDQIPASAFNVPSDYRKKDSPYKARPHRTKE